MNAKIYAVKIAEELTDVLGLTSSDEVDDLVNKIKTAKAIFVAGAGRSSLMLKGFAMRLMQIGFKVYVVGEIVTPAITEDDLLIVGSGSGETGGLVLNATKASKLGATVALITTNPDSSIGKVANITVCIHTSTEKLGKTGSKSIQPGGSTFEQSLLLLGDGIVIRLMEDMDPNVSVMKLHANLE